MNVTARRERFRAVLAGDECICPAPVFDPISARFAEDLGFEVGWMAEQASEATVLGSPDRLVVLLTLSELAQQVRRICRASNISLLTEAHHGYGNALNVMRTVEELEHAGTSALTIADTVQPISFGSVKQSDYKLRSGEQRRISHVSAAVPLVSLEEGVGKVKAALAARQDPSLVIIARTRALHLDDVGSQPEAAIAEVIRRIKAYEKAGVDAINLSGLSTLDQVKAIHAETKLPFVIGAFLLESEGEAVNQQARAAHGIRIEQPWHISLYASMKATYDSLKALRDGKSPRELWPVLSSRDLWGEVTRQSHYDELIKTYLT